MKFKNISKRTKHLKIDRTWLAVKPDEEFEVLKTLGILHLDPELEKVKENTKECSCIPKNGEACSDCSKEKKMASKEEMKKRINRLKKEKKEMIDVSELDEKSKARVKDLKEDLKDDGKRNNSHKKAKPKSKAKPKKK